MSSAAMVLGQVHTSLGSCTTGRAGGTQVGAATASPASPSHTPWGSMCPGLTCTAQRSTHTHAQAHTHHMVQCQRETSQGAMGAVCALTPTPRTRCTTPTPHRSASPRGRPHLAGGAQHPCGRALVHGVRAGGHVDQQAGTHEAHQQPELGREARAQGWHQVHVLTLQHPQRLPTTQHVVKCRAKKEMRAWRMGRGGVGARRLGAGLCGA